jgi:hypothetical protein
LTFATRSALRASQVIAPMVPGANTNRYVYQGSASASAMASWVATAMPARLSFASDGWQV